MTVKDLIERLQEQPDYYDVQIEVTEAGPHADRYAIEDVRQHSGSDGAAAVIVA